MRRWMWVVGVLAACAHRDAGHVRRFACWGDSNTAVYHRKTPIAWCELVAAHDPARYATRNGSLNGISAHGWRKAWTDQIESSLCAADLDGVVIALGTNDITLARTTDEIIDDLRWLVDKARTCQLPAGRQRPVWVLTIPPRLDAKANNDAAVALNAAIERTFGQYAIDVGPEEVGPDGIHLTDAAERRRADLVWRALTH